MEAAGFEFCAFASRNVDAGNSAHFHHVVVHRHLVQLDHTGHR